jgi:hypothetical protein
MNCQFCQTEFNYAYNPPNIYKDGDCAWCNCVTCKVNYKFVNGELARISFPQTINHKIYTICLDYLKSITEIIYWGESYDNEGFGVGTVILELPVLAHLTPDNVTNKLQTMLVFL